jgi:hypothetical protein
MYNNGKTICNGSLYPNHYHAKQDLTILEIVYHKPEGPTHPFFLLG